jgi:alkaline phosphatase D
MNKLLLVLLLIPGLLIAQSNSAIVSGPMLGDVDLRTASIWAEVKPGSTATLKFWKKGNAAKSRQLVRKTDADQWYAPIRFDLTDLEMNTAYEYALQVNGVSKTGSFQTKLFWQWAKPAPDFSFLSGSCAYFNDPQYDQPGKPSGLDSSIFEAMAKEKAAFMVWLGDNWYTRVPDFSSAWGLWYRASHDRSLPVLQNFLKAMPQYAIWDDHDFGPNNSNKSFGFADVSRKIFTNYWANPYYGQDGKGVYTKVSYGDVDLFLLDARTFRSADDLESKVNGFLTDKYMWGEEQMEWLKNSLQVSKATFKLIVSGSQFLNTTSDADCLATEYPLEFKALMDMLEEQKTEGVVFLSGDRHHSEVIQYKRNSAYTLYDITTSPLTSTIIKVSGNQVNHPDRVPGTLVEQQSYARFTVTGKEGARELNVEFAGLKGEKLASWSIKEQDLLYKK